MNRRDALKSILALPLVAGGVPAASTAEVIYAIPGTAFNMESDPMEWIVHEQGSDGVLRRRFVRRIVCGQGTRREKNLLVYRDA